MEEYHGFGDGQNSLPTYQTSPPATIRMPGDSKESSPMKIGDDNNFDSTHKVNELNAGGPAQIASTNGQYGDQGLPVWSQDSVNLAQETGDMANQSVAGMVPEKTPASNVIVDDSPLQNQMERNKECK